MAGYAIHPDFSYEPDQGATCCPATFSVHRSDTANAPSNGRPFGTACARARDRPPAPPHGEIALSRQPLQRRPHRLRHNRPHVAAHLRPGVWPLHPLRHAPPHPIGGLRSLHRRLRGARYDVAPLWQDDGLTPRFSDLHFCNFRPSRGNQPLPQSARNFGPTSLTFGLFHVQTDPRLAFLQLTQIPVHEYNITASPRSGSRRSRTASHTPGRSLAPDPLLRLTCQLFRRTPGCPRPIVPCVQGILWHTVRSWQIFSRAKCSQRFVCRAQPGAGHTKGA